MASSFVGNVNTLTASATINNFDDVILVDSSGGPVIITLPSAASVAEKMYTITGIDFTSSITIDPAGGELIDGLSTRSVSANQASLTIHSDGSQWWTTGGVSIEDNIYTADGSLTGNRILTGDSWNLTNTMTTGDFIITGTTGSVNIDTADGATNSDILITAASGIVSTTTDGANTIVSNHSLANYIVTNTDGTNTSTLTIDDTQSSISQVGASTLSTLTVTETDIQLVAAERVALDGTIQYKDSTKTAAYNVVAGDYYLIGDGSTAVVPFTLPASPEAGDSYMFTASNVTNAVTILGNGKTINGNASLPLDQTYETMSIVYDGTEWFVGIHHSPDTDTNIYTGNGSLISNRTVTGAGFNMDWLMTTGTFNVDATDGASNADIAIAAASGIVNTTTDGTDTVTVTQALNDYTVSHTGATYTSAMNVTEADVTITGGERIVLSGTVQNKVIELVGNTTLVIGTHSSIFANASAGAFTATLPASPESGDTFRVGKDSTPSNNVTIAGNGNNINGATSYVLNTPYETVTLEYNGTFWAAYGA